MDGQRNDHRQERRSGSDGGNNRADSGGVLFFNSLPKTLFRQLDSLVQATFQFIRSGFQTTFQFVDSVVQSLLCGV
jgi:hypothetical protein